MADIEPGLVQAIFDDICNVKHERGCNAQRAIEILIAEEPDDAMKAVLALGGSMYLALENSILDSFKTALDARLVSMAAAAAIDTRH